MLFSIVWIIHLHLSIHHPDIILVVPFACNFETIQVTVTRVSYILGPSPANKNLSHFSTNWPHVLGTLLSLSTNSSTIFGENTKLRHRFDPTSYSALKFWLSGHWPLTGNNFSSKKPFADFNIPLEIYFLPPFNYIVSKRIWVNLTRYKLLQILGLSWSSHTMHINSSLVAINSILVDINTNTLVATSHHNNGNYPKPFSIYMAYFKL